MKALRNEMELIRYRYGDPQKVKEGIDYITWEYYDPEYPDIPSLIVCFEEGVLANIFKVDPATREFSIRYPVMEQKLRREIGKSEDLIEQVRQVLDTEDTNEIQLLLEQAVQAAPSYAEAKYWLGQFYIHHKKWDQAVSILESALADDPRHLAVRFNLALAAHNAQQYKKAKDGCQRILEMSPDSPWHEKAFEVGKVAHHLLSGGEIQDVVQAQKTSPHSPMEAPNAVDINAEQRLGLFLSMNDVDQYSQVVCAFPDQFGVAFLDQIRELWRDFQTQENASTLSSVLAGKVNALAIALKRAGVIGPAEDLLHLVLEIGRAESLDEHVASALANLGNLYRNRRAFNHAQSAFDEAGQLFDEMKLHEQSIQSRFNAALIPLTCERYQEAVSALCEILADCRRLRLTVSLIRCANSLARAYAGLDDFDRASEIAQLALENNRLNDNVSEYAESLTTLAGCELFRGRIRNGLAYLQSIPSLEARRKSTVEAAQWAIGRGQYEISLVLSEAALEMSESKTLDVCSVMSTAYRHLGQVELAEELLLEGQRKAQESEEHDAGIIIAAGFLSLYMHQNYHLAGRPGAFDKLNDVRAKITESIPQIKDRFLLSIVLSNLGYTWHYLGKVAQAAAQGGVAGAEKVMTECFQNSIDITGQAAEIAAEIRDIEGIAVTENQLATNYIELNRWEQAEINLNEAMKIWSTEKPDKPGQIGRAYYNRFRICRALGRHEEALQAARLCVKQVERVRQSAYSEPFLISIWTEWERLFQEVIEYSVEQCRNQDAMFYLECIKSRAFLDVLQQVPDLDIRCCASIGTSEREEIDRHIERFEEMLESSVAIGYSAGLIRRAEERLGVARLRKRLAESVSRRRLSPDCVETQTIGFDGILETLADA